MTAPPDTVFFLSDYGLGDGFVGLVHAVVRRLAPSAAVIDLTHGIAPFDVRGAAFTLARAVPHLGPGVVLAVVDPGVGGSRRGLVLEVTGEPRYLVGPDNGLLVPAAEVLGGVVRAGALDAGPGPSTGAAGATFDGRDVFGPAAAALCRGADPGELTTEVAVETLAHVTPPVVDWRVGTDGRLELRAEVTSVDRFGNVQLAARADDRFPPRRCLVRVARPDRPARPAVEARLVTAFEDLEPGELGLLVDSDGQLALVMAASPAAGALGVVAGDLVEVSGAGLSLPTTQ